MSKLLLIDADVLCYRSAFAAEKTKYLVSFQTEDGYTVHDDAKEAKEAASKYDDALLWSRKDVQPEETAILIFNSLLNDIKEHYAQENLEVRLYLSPSVGNFREQLATRAKYKGNRDDMARPKHLGACRARANQQGGLVAVGAEADDYLALDLMANPGSVCASIDKDLLTVPGRHYNFVKKEEFVISKRQADMNFWLQVITGDSSDNIPGVEGYGPVKATKVLAGAKSNAECWSRIIELYTEVYKDKGPEYALECARLVKLGQSKDALWNPPSYAA